MADNALATMPAEVGTAKDASGGRNFALLNGMGQLPVLRQLGLMVGIALSVALGAAVVMWSREPSYQPLYNNISQLDQTQIANILTQAQIDYRIDPDNGVLLVDARKVTDAKMKLAAAGLPVPSTQGYELLDTQQFGQSQFMESARYQRSVEGELSRTIASMVNVKDARVHLAVPKRSVFVGDERKPSASVFISLSGTQSLDKGQVSAIVHLVASSVPEMDPKDVTVVDQRGRLLSEGALDEGALMSAHQLEYQRKVEDNLINRVRSILMPLVGQDGFRVEVSADMDFSIVEQTAEQFNPDLPALRSEQTMAENQSGTAGVIGVPGALSNQPPAGGQAPQQATGATAPAGQAAAGGQAGTSPSNSRQQATRNFELDRTISHTRQQVGTVKRLSVAVAVDNKLAPVAAGKAGAAPKRVALTPQELERLNVLVKDAAGFDAARGDRVSVINQPFIDAQLIMGEEESVPIWERTWFSDMLRQVLAALVILVLLLAVLRPIMRQLARAGGPTEEEAAAAAAGGLPGATLQEGQLGAQVTLTGMSEDLLLPGPHEGFEGQLAAVRAMVAEDPARVAQVVKNWIAEES